MSEYICFLISILYNERILKCALRVKRDSLGAFTERARVYQVADYPMEPQSKKVLHENLPLHVRECGPIVDVEEIFEVESKE